jgi:hypothetical protein
MHRTAYVQSAVTWSAADPSACSKVTVTVAGSTPATAPGVPNTARPCLHVVGTGLLEPGNDVVLPGKADHTNVIWESITRCHFAVVLPPIVQVTVYFGVGAAPATPDPNAATNNAAAAPITRRFLISPSPRPLRWL